jgi:hypothetical protein
VSCSHHALTAVNTRMVGAVMSSLESRVSRLGQLVMVVMQVISWKISWDAGLLQ